MSNRSGAVRLASRALAIALVGSSGCSVFEPEENWLYEKSLIAVVAFENRANFPLDWQLGDGIAQILEDRLYQTGDFRLLDRSDIDAVLAEQEFQRTGRTRSEEVVPANRLKNAHFLVKGTITEFAHVSLAGMDFGIGWFRIGGGGVHAIVSIALKVIEVESGEVVYSRVVEGKAYAGEIDVGAVYAGIALGGYQFEQTPLGRALAEALDVAVDKIDDRIGKRLWRPSIVEIDGPRIVLSGGADRRIEPGSLWLVRRIGAPVFDPATGDFLGRHAGEELGTIRVTRVEERFSIAEVAIGEGFEKGQRCEPFDPAETRAPPRSELIPRLSPTGAAR
jgi:curli biogenesis system outer membrane secretion channel CsgG